MSAGDNAAQLPDLASQVRADCADQGFTHAVIDSLVDEIAKRCASVARTYGAEIAQ